VKLSVVIPALNEAERIGEAIASARRSAGSEVEIIVVDGGSEDRTPDRAAEAGARVIPSRPGRARQLGVGARASRGDVLLFLHADTILPAGWDAAIGEALGAPEVVGGAFRFRFDRHTAGLRVIEWGTRLRVALFRMPYGDQALFIRRQTLCEIGGVPQAPIMEDLDLVRAMKRRGRLALLGLPAVTSARRYAAGGALRTALRHWTAMAAWGLGIDRGRVAAWYGR
jgi:rSAM/selenodomain-associated transferase 2